MVSKYLISGSSAQSDDPRAMVEDTKGSGYLRSPVSDLRSLGSMEGVSG